MWITVGIIAGIGVGYVAIAGAIYATLRERAPELEDDDAMIWSCLWGITPFFLLGWTFAILGVAVTRAYLRLWRWLLRRSPSAPIPTATAKERTGG